jgi:hypothetical protein
MSGKRIPLVVIGIDPGLKGHGYAMLDALNGELLTAGFVRRSTKTNRGAKVWASLASSLVSSLGLYRADTVMVEQPRAYAHHPADPNDLIEIACAGTYAAAAVVAGSRSPCTFCSVEARRWKGQVPKDIMVNRIRSKLTEAEVSRIDLPASKSYHPDVFDAVGIAKWAVSEDRW